MARDHIRYRSGYKYQLVDEYAVEVTVIPEENIHMDFMDLSTSGELVINKAYAWDGPSGPSIDTKNFMRGSLVHDALYQIMRWKPEKLPAKRWRKNADLDLKRICIEDGMARFRAWYVYLALRLFGDPAASPDRKKQPHTAP